MTVLARITTRLSHLLALKGLDRAEHRLAVRWGLCWAAVAMALRVLFWGYTGRCWEDSLTACLHAENFVRGLGLTHFHPGEAPVQGFTSPFSVFVHIAGEVLHHGWGIGLLQLLSIPAAGLTILFLLALGIHASFRLPLPLLVMVMGYAAIEHHQILWGMSGMETQFSVLLLVASLYYAVAWNPTRLGLSVGLCMLARPDYAFWTVIIGAYALFREPRALFRIVALALAAYGPWLLFATVYYGSPIPNTIIAKGLGFAPWWEKAGGVNFFTIKRQIWLTMSEQLHVMLAPTFCGHGTGVKVLYTGGPESPIANAMFAFSVLGTLALLIRRQYAWWPVAACAVGYSLYYVFGVPALFGWYKMPLLLTLLLLAARGLQAATGRLPGERFRSGAQWALALLYLALFAAVLPRTFEAERRIQRDIENPVRKAAGLYMAGVLQSGEAIGCEPLGYMAYYSRGEVYDWPGLCSRKVVAWSKAHPGERSLEAMLKHFQPEYLFLRDLEVRFVFKDPEWLRGQYHPVRVFAADAKAVEQIPWVDRNIDTNYRIYRKNHVGDAPYDAALWPDPAPPAKGEAHADR